MKSPSSTPPSSADLELKALRDVAKAEHRRNRRRKLTSLAAKAILALVIGGSLLAYHAYASDEQATRRRILEIERQLEAIEGQIKEISPVERHHRELAESLRRELDSLETQDGLLIEQLELLKARIPKAGAAEYPGLRFGPIPDVKIAWKLPEPKPDYDLDKLAHAVAFAETASCTDGTAVRRKNCFGIMHWPNGPGSRTPKTYASHEESYADFKRIWSKFYGRFPDRALAVKWTGDDNADTWLSNVKFRYSQP